MHFIFEPALIERLADDTSREAAHPVGGGDGLPTHHAGSILRTPRAGVREIVIPPIKSAIGYAAALHEIGHHVAPQYEGEVLLNELTAWSWAWANARVWTPAMDRARERSLATYCGLKRPPKSIKGGGREPVTVDRRAD